MSKLVIAVLAGTTRERRMSDLAAAYIAEFGRTLPDIEIVVAKPGDFNLPGDGNDEAGRDTNYTALTARADAFFVVVPEYNHSFPGSLKRMLDSEYANYIHKPVAFAGVSNGAWGGTRAVEALVPAVREMGLVATSWSVYFPKVQDMFDVDGVLMPAFKESVDSNLKHAFDELVWMATTLAWGRKHL